MCGRYQYAYRCSTWRHLDQQQYFNGYRERSIGQLYSLLCASGHLNDHLYAGRMYCDNDYYCKYGTSAYFRPAICMLRFYDHADRGDQRR